MQLLSSRRWRAAAATAAVLGLVLTGCSSEETFSYTPPEQVDATLPDETVAALQGAVDNAIAASGASGAIVGVWVPWSGTWVAATGTQSKADGGELSTDMSFRIADVTRLMTCDVLYALADEGTVELDATVPEYVSGVADMSDVTLVDLCNGTSGAGSSEATVKSAWLNTPERVWAPLELAGYGLGRARIAPQTTFRDSDAGYLLLGLALERASGMSARELIAEYVTEPLELADTSLPAPAATGGARFAQQLSWELAAIASKAPAASGETAPEFGLPYTAEQYHKATTDAALVCVPPAG